MAAAPPKRHLVAVTQKASVSPLGFLNALVQWGLRYVFYCLVHVSEMSAQSAGTCINHAVLKRQLAQCVQVKSFTNVSTD